MPSILEIAAEQGDWTTDMGSSDSRLVHAILFVAPQGI